LNDTTLDRSERFTRRRKRAPKLAILTSEDPSAQSYLRSIGTTAGRVGVALEEIPIKPGTTTESALSLVAGLNDNHEIDGILLQTPVTEGVDARAVARALDPSRDVDGITPMQAGMLFQGMRKAMAPSTARACIEILDYYKYGLEGVEVVVVGRSLVVGRPVALLALSRNATVTWCHTKTLSLSNVCKRAEILIVAAGRPGFVGAGFVRPGATVIDVGINVGEDGKLVGDVDVAGISSMAAAYTPVPGGVGPVTVASLFANLLDLAEVRGRQA
jgi:methylenetetrahydrofolate dehydrogenase (NADP+)/methenyltetrahydrofolate cyclohydrolase